MLGFVNIFVVRDQIFHLRVLYSSVVPTLMSFILKDICWSCEFVFGMLAVTFYFHLWNECIQWFIFPSDGENEGK